MTTTIAVAAKQRTAKAAAPAPAKTTFRQVGIPLALWKAVRQAAAASEERVVSIQAWVAAACEERLAREAGR